MKSLASFATQQLMCVIIILDPIWASENAVSSDWTKMKISPDVLCSMPYGDFRINIYEHIKNHISTTLIFQKRYFYTPIALVDHKSAESKYNNVTQLSETRVRIEMWNDQVQSEVVNYLPQIVGQEIKSFQVQVIPFEKVVLTTTKPSTVYSLSTNWLPYQLEKSLWFSLTCFSQKDCNQLKDIMHQDPTEFDNLQMLFSLSSQTTKTKEIVIDVGHTVSSQLVNQLLKQCITTEYALITPEEEKRLLSEIKNNIIVESFDDSDIVSPHSQSQIYYALNDLLLSKVETKQNEKIDKFECWNSKKKEMNLEISGIIEEEAENGDDWSEINGKTEVDYASLDILAEVSADDRREEDKKSVLQSILLSRINLKKLRNRESMDNLRVRVRYSTALLSTFVHFVQFAKLSTSDEWAGLKKELGELKVQYQTLKNDQQVLNINYTNMKIVHQNFTRSYSLDINKTNTQLSAFRTDYVSLKTEYQNLKEDHKKLSADYQSLKAEYENSTSNYKQDLNNTKTKLTVFDRNHNILNTDYQKLKTEYQSLKKDHEQMSVDYQGLKVDSGNFTSKYRLDLNNTNTKLSVLDRYHNILNTDYQKLKTEYQSLKKDHGKLNDDYQNLKADNGNFTNKYRLDLNNTNTKLSVFDRNHNILNTDYQKLKAEYQDLKKNHGKLSTDYQSLKTDYGNLTSNYRLALNNTNTKLSVFDRNHNNLNNDYQKQKTEYQNLKKDHEKLSVDYNSLKADHGNLTSKYRLDFNITNKKLSELRMEFSDATTDISFSACRTSEFKNEKNFVPFQNITLNNGNSLNITTGIFTAPKAGTYLFTFHGNLSVRKIQHVIIALNGEAKTRIINDGYGYSYSETSSMSIVLSLKTNDNIGVYLHQGILNDFLCFSGILVQKKM